MLSWSDFFGGGFGDDAMHAPTGLCERTPFSFFSSSLRPGREFADFAFARIGFDAGGDSGWVEEDIVPEWLGVAWPRDGIKGIQLVMEMSNDAKTRGTYNEEAIRGNIALSEMQIPLNKP